MGNGENFFKVQKKFYFEKLLYNVYQTAKKSFFQKLKKVVDNYMIP